MGIHERKLRSGHRFRPGMVMATPCIRRCAAALEVQGPAALMSRGKRRAVRKRDSFLNVILRLADA
jgi:hypothetical protein